MHVEPSGNGLKCCLNTKLRKINFRFFISNIFSNFVLDLKIETGYESIYYSSASIGTSASIRWILHSRH